MSDTQTRTVGPVLETVSRVILHCSRCNTQFKDCYHDVTLWTQDSLDEAFPKDFVHGPWEVNGWIRVGDRILCPDCWEYDHADVAGRVERDPLPAADADKVTRTQMRYRVEGSPANPFRYTGMTTDEFLAVLDDVRSRVAEGDSFEGYVEYAIPEDAAAEFDVRAGYRIGNRNGQGSFRLIAKQDEVASDA